MHLEAEIKSLRDALGGQDRVERRDGLQGLDRAGSEMHIGGRVQVILDQILRASRWLANQVLRL